MFALEAREHSLHNVAKQTEGQTNGGWKGVAYKKLQQATAICLLSEIRILEFHYSHSKGGSYLSRNTTTKSIITTGISCPFCPKYYFYFYFLMGNTFTR